MRLFCNGFLMGLLAGMGGMVIIPKACASTQPAPIIAEKFTAEKHGGEIQKPIHRVEARGGRAVFTYELPTEYYGILKGEVQASRAALQYRHKLGLGAVLLNTALLGRISYGYKNVEFSLYGGWDYKNRGALVGGGLGYSWGF